MNAWIETALVCHPTSLARAVARVACALRRAGEGLEFIYSVDGDIAALVVPPRASADRADGLWRSTCLEAFVATQEGGYQEFNFAPSSRWAAYRFTGPREGMASLALNEPPGIDVSQQADQLVVSVRLGRIVPGPLRLGITAVIEEKDGTKSYWALRHGGNAPDFHDPDCFVVQLPPAD
jgi:hypothetical protein